MNNYNNPRERYFETITNYTRKCSCGCSVTIFPTTKREYIVCRWCGKKVFKDLEKQKQQDRKVEGENFRMKLRTMI